MKNSAATMHLVVWYGVTQLTFADRFQCCLINVVNRFVVILLITNLKLNKLVKVYSVEYTNIADV
jgi:hypothetical protein